MTEEKNEEDSQLNARQMIEMEAIKASQPRIAYPSGLGKSPPPLDDAKLREQVEQITALLPKVTARPWKWTDVGGMPQLEGQNEYPDMNPVLVAYVCRACEKRGAPCLSGSPDDRAYIEAACNLTPELLALIARQQQTIAELSKPACTCACHFPGSAIMHCVACCGPGTEKRQPPTEMIATLAEKDRVIAEQQAVIEKLPLTADGVPIVPGMEVWEISMSGNVNVKPLIVPQWFNQSWGNTYSTRDAAIAAAESKGADVKQEQEQTDEN